MLSFLPQGLQEEDMKKVGNVKYGQDTLVDAFDSLVGAAGPQK
jgi:hypothetical protein